MTRRLSTAFTAIAPDAFINTFGGAALSAEMIMSKHCENCGCAIRSGYCTNCQEEAYVAFVQAPEMEFSEEFIRESFRQDSDSRAREAS